MRRFDVPDIIICKLIGLGETNPHCVSGPMPYAADPVDSGCKDPLKQAREVRSLVMAAALHCCLWWCLLQAVSASTDAAADEDCCMIFPHLLHAAAAEQA